MICTATVELALLKNRILRMIPVILAFARVTGIIRQYPRSLIRCAHSPARSLKVLLESRLYCCSATLRLFQSSHTFSLSIMST